MASTAVAKPEGQTQDSQLVLLQTVAAIELYRSQRKVAQYLELAYLNLRDHPDVAKEVRMTAHDSRERHLLTTELMKKFQATGYNIINNLIPNIYDAVDLQDVQLVKDVFTKIIKSAEIMQQESEKTRQSYLEIQRRVQENKASVNERNKHVVDETDRLTIAMQHQDKLVKAAQEAQDELDEQNQKMEQELEDMKTNRYKLLQKEEDFNNKQEGMSALDKALVPVGVLGVVTFGVGFVAAAVMGGFSIFSHIKQRELNEKTAKILRDNVEHAEEEYHDRMDEQTKLIEKMHNKRLEELDKLNEYKKLCMNKAKLGDVQSLEEAALYLWLVDKQFTRISMFWSNMAAILTYLKDDVDAGSVYLKKIEDCRYASRFKKSLSRAEADWKLFNVICKDYVIENDKEIFVLYEFLSAPLETVSQEDRDTRQKALLKRIKDEINAAYGYDPEIEEKGKGEKKGKLLKVQKVQKIHKV